MTFTRVATTLSILVVAACGSGVSGSQIAWGVSQSKTVSYRITVKSAFSDPGGPKTVQRVLQVTYSGSGKATVAEGSQSLGSFDVDQSGALSAPFGTQQPPPELDVLAINGSPLSGTIKLNQSWTRMDPSDAEVAAAPNRIFIQSKRVYDLKQVLAGSNEIVVDVAGSVRAVDTPGARKAIKGLAPTADQPDGSGHTLFDQLSALTNFSPYMFGTVHFDTKKGELVRYDGVGVLELGGSYTQASLTSAPNRVELTVERI